MPDISDKSESVNPRQGTSKVRRRKDEGERKKLPPFAFPRLAPQEPVGQVFNLPACASYKLAPQKPVGQGFILPAGAQVTNLRYKNLVGQDFILPAGAQVTNLRYNFAGQDFILPVLRKLQTCATIFLKYLFSRRRFDTPQLSIFLSALPAAFSTPEATLFITFRLAGSLPKSVLAELNKETKRMNDALNRITDPVEQKRWAERTYRRQFGLWDRALDTADVGPRYLQQPAVANIVSDCLRGLDGRFFNLFAFCIMPNHVHLVCKPLARGDGSYYSLAKILHSLKRHTASLANKLLSRKGIFWQHESYDHVVRNEDELRRVIEYVVNNPVTAGLVRNWEDWRWTYVAE